MYDPKGKFNQIFTNTERLYDRISHKRLSDLINNRGNSVTSFSRSHNCYGEFLFVTLHFSENNESLTFYGAGFDENRDTYIINSWRFYQGAESERKIDKGEVLAEIEKERKSLETLAKNHKQSKEGKIFSILAELTDDDGAMTELQDFPGLYGLFDDDGQEPLP